MFTKNGIEYFSPCPTSYIKLSNAQRKTLFTDTNQITNEPRLEISNSVVCATSKDSDQPVHTRSLISAFASRLNIFSVKLLTEHHLELLSFIGGCTVSSWSTLVKMPHCLQLHAAAQLLFPVSSLFFFHSSSSSYFLLNTYLGH